MLQATSGHIPLSPARAGCKHFGTKVFVDLSQTDVIEILGSTFVLLTAAATQPSPRNSPIIEQEAFLKCTSLQEVCIPPSLLFIARFVKKGKAKHGSDDSGDALLLHRFDYASRLTKPKPPFRPHPLRFSEQE